MTTWPASSLAAHDASREGESARSRLPSHAGPRPFRAAVPGRRGSHHRVDGHQPAHRDLLGGGRGRLPGGLPARDVLRAARLQRSHGEPRSVCELLGGSGSPSFAALCWRGLLSLTLSRYVQALPRHDLRVPDERPRLGADQGHARVDRPRRGADAGGRRRRRLQHLHDPRETRPAPRRAPRAGEGAQGPRPGARDRRRRLLRRGAARPDLRALPVRRRRLRPGLDSASRRVARRRRPGRSRRTSGRRACSRIAIRIG